MVKQNKTPTKKSAQKKDDDVFSHRVPTVDRASVFPLPEPGRLGVALRDSILTCSWLDATQNAPISLALALADTLDSNPELLKDARMVAQYRGALADLGFTVDSRPQPAPQAEEVDWIDQVKETAPRVLDAKGGNTATLRPVGKPQGGRTR